VTGDQAARFSGRVDDYVKTRPSYPRGVLDVRDREGLVSRLLSSSYAPGPGEPTHDETIAELRSIFDRRAESGLVAML
jgi:hypothetical protein